MTEEALSWTKEFFSELIGFDILIIEGSLDSGSDYGHMSRA
jgi:hypothetical protein